jgi:microcystin-dependent protein
MSEKNFVVKGSIEINGVNIDLTSTQVGSSLHRIGNQFTAKQETPIGAVVMYTGLINAGKTNLPDGWLLCDGSEIAVSSFPLLDAVVGTRYGSRTNGSGGAGTSHFRVPNLTDKIPVGHIQTNTDAPNTVTSTVDDTTLAIANHAHTASHGSDPVDGVSTHGHNLTTGNSGHTHNTNANKSNNGHNLGGDGIFHSHSYKYGNAGAAQFSFRDSSHEHGQPAINISHGHIDGTGASVTAHANAHTTSAASLDHSHSVVINASDANMVMNNTSHSHSNAFTVVKVFFIIKASNGVV